MRLAPTKKEREGFAIRFRKEFIEALKELDNMERLAAIEPMPEKAKEDPLKKTIIFLLSVDRRELSIDTNSTKQQVQIID